MGSRFLVEVYKGDAWTPFLLWGTNTNFRGSLLKLEKYCHNKHVSMDTHRIRHLTDESDIIDAGRTIERSKHAK